MREREGTNQSAAGTKPGDPAAASPQGSLPGQAEGKPRREPLNLWRIFLFLVFLTLAYSIFQLISINRYGFRDDGRKADCAIILGTAAWHDKPSPVLKERLNHAIKLYQQGRVRALVLTGGKGTGAAYSEAAVARDYCIGEGIPASALFTEETSRTTVENLVEAGKVLQRENLESALIVSDPWHLKRGVLIAKRQGIQATQSGTTTSKFESFKARSNFVLREFYLYHVFLVFGK